MNAADTPSARLAALGIELPAPTAPAGSYVPAAMISGLVSTSGQVPFKDGALMATGLVGAEISQEEAAACARQCAITAIAAAADVVGGVDNLAGVAEITGYVASAPGFTAQPQVLNGASDLCVEVFGDAGRHIRSAVGVAVLPLGVPVEVAIRFIPA